jgi:hypothetical protein
MQLISNVNIFFGEAFGRSTDIDFIFPGFHEMKSLLRLLGAHT